MEQKEQEGKPENKVILDGKEVTREQLSEAQSNKSIRITETSDGTYKTLTKLHG